ncbi:hypothetical protein PM023_16225 [Halorubrum ezzemoulense]|uniref:hypothetical protein n=1 Tax=Halorubrum ezzemoulense TaxID=337243 RepID=UPI0023300C84|nr:hypothetical protein [Halorubrum ezzemoulense]MDB2226194.1 hypothetical protein [Halorubrum ezzemoulense]
MISERTQTLLAVVFAVLLLPAGAVVAQTATFTATENVQLGTNSGVIVTLGDAREPPSDFTEGNTTFVDSSLRLNGSDADIEVTDGTYGGNTISAQQIEVSGSLTIERTDLARSMTITDGDATQLQLREYALDDNQSDLAYDSENGLTVELGGFNEVGIVAVDTGTGEPLDSDIVEADGTATFELPAGQRTIALELAPSELRVFSEQNPDQLLSDVNDLTIEFYEQSANNPDNIESVEVVNGVADMEGLDPTVSFVAVANADGYANRRIFVDSLYETQELYLLNESADSVAVEYELEDFSGNYPQAETVMVVERNINGEWTPIQGDFFGATGKFEAQLLRDTRHRMRVVNIETGEERVAGAVTPQQSAVETVTILPDGSITVDQGLEQIHAQPALGSIPAAQAAEFGVDIQAGDQEITSWSIEIRLMENTTETTLATRNGTGTGVETFNLDLTGADGGTVMAVVDYNTANSSGTVRLSREIRANYAGAEGLLGGLITIGDGLGAGTDSGPSSASMMAALFVSLLITGGVARVSTSADVMGISALVSVAGFAILGWVPMSLLFAATVGFGAMIALRRGI